jgi:hypothetical protein
MPDPRENIIDKTSSSATDQTPVAEAFQLPRT